MGTHVLIMHTKALFYIIIMDFRSDVPQQST